MDEGSEESEHATYNDNSSNESTYDSERATTPASATDEITRETVKAEHNAKLSGRKAAGAQKQRARLESHLSESYREVLNATIREVNGAAKVGEFEPLATSLIGASCWTALEKEVFFAELALSGAGDLRALASAVGTKSEVEVKAYVLLLQAGVREAEATLRLEERFSLADVPAACEVGGSCEDAADLAADALRKLVEDQDAKRERERFGEWWLIDEDVAEVIDDQCENSLLEEKHAEAKVEGNLDENSEITTTNDHLGESESSTAKTSPGLPIRSAALLRPSAFLQLSRTLFMNSSTDPESNWHSLAESHPGQSSPSIYRTAFDDFHNLALSLTRRLVQASIFQSLSRLRAASDSRIVPAISGADVEAAVDIVGMKADRMKYWATAAERCGVEVYSEAKRFRDGRQTGKYGVRLSSEEVELELGISRRDQGRSREGGQIVTDAEIDDLENDSDAFTSETSGDEHGRLESEDEKSGRSGPASPEAASRGRTAKSSKRKRAVSPRSYDRAETAFLEQVDRLASLEEENSLRDILRLDQLLEPEDRQPEMAYRRTRQERQASEWRETVHYQAPWEQHGSVDESEFEGMEMAGKRGRKRRMLVRKAMRQRMDGSGSSPESSEDAKMEALSAENSGESESDE